jgi:hypothetical protein
MSDPPRPKVPTHDAASSERAALEAMLAEEEGRGHPRVVAPYCHGFTRAGDEALRAVQLRGSSHSGHFASGKLWTISKMRLVRTLEERFVADDSDYEPNDSAMVRVHCCV